MCEAQVSGAVGFLIQNVRRGVVKPLANEDGRLESREIDLKMISIIHNDREHSQLMDDCSDESESRRVGTRRGTSS